MEKPCYNVAGTSEDNHGAGPPVLYISGLFGMPDNAVCFGNDAVRDVIKPRCLLVAPGLHRILTHPPPVVGAVAI